MKNVRPETPAAPGKRSKAGGAVALLLVVGLGAALHQAGVVDRMRADHATTVGEIASIRLQDGSTVTLNTDTALTVRFQGGERRIELLRGEAFFDVAKDPTRPFTVTSGALSATARGTRFDVASAPADGVEVQVEEGRVEVAEGARIAMLDAGDAAVRGPSGEIAKTTAAIDVGDATAWRDGKLVVSGRRLGEVLATIERYRRGRIVVLDQRAAKLRVSGTFDLRDTDQAIASIEASLPVTTTRLTGALILIRSRD